MRSTGVRLVSTVLAVSLGILAHGQTLTVLAAASLRESFSTLARDFERSHPGTRVRLTFAGSQQLAASILLDAPGDVFASADEAQMKRVVDARKANEKGFLCSNRLVVVVSVRAAKRIHELGDLGSAGVRLVLAKPAVPAGSYADKVIARLPSAEARAINANVKSREQDVRTVLARVELGEADAGVVYTTDVAAKPGSIRTVTIPDRLQTPVSYVIGKVARTSQSALADDFIKMTLAGAGQHVLRLHGFLPPPVRRTGR